MTEVDDIPLDPAITEVMRALDLALIEWLPDQTYLPLSSAPRWFRGRAPWGSLPFLEHFVGDARRFLHDQVGSVLTSEPFTVADGDGEELLLRARALRVEGRLIVAIERLQGASDLRPMLRTARQEALAHEQLVERVRALHAPIDALAKAIANLQSVPEGGPLDALAAAMDTLRAAAALLPPPRKRR